MASSQSSVNLSELKLHEEASGEIAQQTDNLSFFNRSNAYKIVLSHL